MKIYIRPGKELPWFLHYIEPYAHLLLELKFENLSNVYEILKTFKLELITEDFEGLLLYIFDDHSNLRFDILNNPNDITHQIAIDILDPKRICENNFYFCLIPFGFFKLDNRIQFQLDFDHYKPHFKLYAWNPSFLFKKMKSFIKINNNYQEVIPDFNYPIPAYHLQPWFKANDRKLIFNLINSLSQFDKIEAIESKLDVTDIKKIITKANKFIFEKKEETIIIEGKNILNELIRLKNNIENLSKDRIAQWIDDILDYYSEKVSKGMDFKE